MSEFSTLICGNPSHPPLIFLHGFLGAKEDWEEMLSFFKKHFFCIAFDLPGHGSTTYCDDILPALKEEVLKGCSVKPILIGYSMGGRLALQLQEHARAIVAISAHPGLKTTKEKELRKDIDVTWRKKLLTLSWEAFLAEWYAQPIFLSLHRKPDLLQQILKKRFMQNPENLNFRFLSSESAEIFDEIAHTFSKGVAEGAILERIKPKVQVENLSRVLLQLSLSNQPHISQFLCPTLFLYGEEDLKYRKLYCNMAQNTIVQSIKKCGHAVHLEDAKACAEEILNWFMQCKYLKKK